MLEERPFRIDVSMFCRCAGIVLIYCGTFNSMIVAGFGGFASILFGCLLFFGAMFSRIHWCARENKYLWQAACWLMLFVLIYIFSWETHSHTSVKTFGFGIELTLEGFNVMKNAPIWGLGFFIGIDLDGKALKRCFKLVCILLVWGMIATIVALYGFPDYVRYRTAGMNVAGYAFLGAMGYELAYTIPIVAFPIFSALRRRRPVFAYLFLAICTFYIIKCSLLLAIIAFMLSVSLSLVASVRSGQLRTSIWILIVLMGILVLLNLKTVGGILISISEAVSDINISLRLEQIGRFLRYGDREGASLNRLKLYENSIKGFLKSPIFGMFPMDGAYSVSGHSTILDMLSGMGLTAGVPFAAFLLAIYRHLGVDVDRRSRRIARVGLITFVFIALLNPVLANSHILFAVAAILPLCAHAGNTRKRRPHRRGVNHNADCANQHDACRQYRQDYV